MILNEIDPTNPIGESLKEEVGESKEAEVSGVLVNIHKLKEWFGKDEDMDAFINYKEFERKKRNTSENLLKFINEWENLYDKC